MRSCLNRCTFVLTKRDNNLNLNIMYTIAELIKFTDESLKNWYLNAKEDYNIDGKGKCFYNEEDNEIVIYYVENGEKKVWSMAFYDEYRKEQKINWVYNCWMELC